MLRQFDSGDERAVGRRDEFDGKNGIEHGLNTVSNGLYTGDRSRAHVYTAFTSIRFGAPRLAVRAESVPHVHVERCEASSVASRAPATAAVLANARAPADCGAIRGDSGRFASTRNDAAGRKRSGRAADDAVADAADVDADADADADASAAARAIDSFDGPDIHDARRSSDPAATQ
ncbi:hypothetical protein [Burkholderia sp. ABCPW 111]|uniref:hypothetical protein n=1 Tax=Burkholderia sp. ABCPW 111 TaxID=1820025 RepID=UPI0013922CF5|nr:hypothetical protein [Burkholderia sp. ABCPW 111]